MGEVRLALRRLLRKPGRTIVGAVTLALGIGASTAAFSAVLAVLLTPLPVADQDALVVLWRQNPARDFVHVPFPPAAVDLLSDRATALQASAGFDIVARSAVADDGETPVQVAYRRVTGPFFDVLGVSATAGRLLTEADDRVGAEPVVVVSHGFWQSVGGGDPHFVGSRLQLDGRAFRVVGVAAPGFEFPLGTDLWASLRGSGPPPRPGRPGAEMDVVARLAPGVGPAEAARQSDALLEEDPDLGPSAVPLEPVATPLVEHVVGSFEPVLEAGMMVALLVLLVAVANAALLFLSGGGAALREIAARRALGASRWRVVTPLLAEAGVLSVLGAVLGIALAATIVAVLLPLAPAELPRLTEAALDRRSLAFAVAVAAVAMLASGGLAGWWLSRGQPADALAASGRGSVLGGEGLRKGIATAQIAFAVVAAVGAGLLVRTVGALDGLDRGFSDEGAYLVGLGHGHPIFEVPERYVRELQGVVEALAEDPAIDGATPTLNRPLDFNAGVEMSPTVEGSPPTAATDRPYVSLDAVLPNFFQVMRMGVRAGRTFGPEDDASGERVVVVNETAARLLWPEGAPLGRRVGVYPGEPDTWGTVVGVVADTRYRAFRELRPAVFVPLSQYSSIPPGILVVRARGEGVPVRDLVAAALGAQAPDVRPLAVESLAEVMGRPLVLPRFAAAVFTTGSLVTLLLAALGVYGVFAVLVQERRQELGLRRALGARSGHLARYVAVRVLVVGAWGAGAGVLASVWLTSSLEALLFGVKAIDPVTFAGVLAATLAVALLAAVVPAGRAIGTDPARALRTE